MRRHRKLSKTSTLVSVWGKKKTSKPEIERNFLNLKKGYLQKSKINIILDGELLEEFPLQSAKK